MGDDSNYMSNEKRKDNSAWSKVLLVRNNNRFRSLEIIDAIFESFIELHGDRGIEDDKSMVCGIAMLDKIAVTVVSQQKGNSQSEMKYRQYGMTKPSGYRKAIRLMKQAEKFGRPIICIIDTPGAFPGISAENRGQAEAIAKNLYEMSNLKVPIISIVIGEGGSGGALALGVANKIIMLENSIFSVITPEGCASILWKDAKMAQKVAEYLKLTAQDLYSFGIIDYIISEEGSLEMICCRIRECILEFLKECSNQTGEELKQNRQLKYRGFDKHYLKNFQN